MRYIGQTVYSEDACTISPVIQRMLQLFKIFNDFAANAVVACEAKNGAILFMVSLPEWCSLEEDKISVWKRAHLSSDNLQFDIGFLLYSPPPSL